MIPEAPRILSVTPRATACTRVKVRSENEHPNDRHGSHEVKPIAAGMMMIAGKAKDEVRGQVLLLRGGKE